MSLHDNAPWYIAALIFLGGLLIAGGKWIGGKALGDIEELKNKQSEYATRDELNELRDKIDNYHGDNKKMYHDGINKIISMLKK